MTIKNYDQPGAIKRLPGETFASFSYRQKQSQAVNVVREAIKKQRVRASNAKSSRKAKPSQAE